MSDRRADALSTGPSLGDRVAELSESDRRLVEHLGIRLDEVVSSEQGHIGLDRLVPRVQLGKRAAQAVLRILDRRELREVWVRVLGRPVLRASLVERAVVGEVRVDGVALDARPLSDCADRRPRRTDAGVQVDRRPDNALPRLFLAPSPFFELILTVHCTTVYRDLDIRARPP